MATPKITLTDSNEVYVGDFFELDGRVYKLINSEDAIYLHDGKKYCNHIWNLRSKYNTRELVEANWKRVDVLFDNF